MNNVIREIIYSEEYEAYYRCLDAKIQTKYDYLENIIRTQDIVNKKFIKKLENTMFYEARVSAGTIEYRTIVFAIDAKSFIESQRVLFLNSFLKKDSKQYKREIEKAKKILLKYIEED